jgi:hypothetical protein
VVLKLKTAWRDGTTHLVISPLEFMQWLAVLVPRPVFRLDHQVSPSDDNCLELNCAACSTRKEWGAPVRDFRMPPFSCDLVSGFG